MVGSYSIMTQLRHYDDSGLARFVTFACHKGYPLFTNPDIAQLFIDHLSALRSNQNIKIFAYVLMPEHVHLVLLPPENVKLGILIGQMKGRFARDVVQLWEQQGATVPKQLCNVEHGTRKHIIWKRRCHDHNCRNIEAVKTRIEYCHYNPVRRGLVKKPDAWKWSSCQWYMGKKDIPLEMDSLPPP
jgi:putative transposase